ncbi:MAG TPA: hypothetical protein VMB72_14985 [Acidimicrobiales bacterium]|nr:hypothetical protein [Acidimicrobiales bacterium]
MRTGGALAGAEPAPVLTRVQTLRPGTEDVLGDEGWVAVVGELRGRIERVLERHRVYSLTEDSGVLVPRDRTPGCVDLGRTQPDRVRPKNSQIFCQPSRAASGR